MYMHTHHPVVSAIILHARGVPCTVSVIVAESFPAMLEAWQVNMPSSWASVTPCTVSTLPSELIWYRPPLVNSFPFRVQVWTGTGSPVALHTRVAVLPSIMITVAKSAVIVGGAVHKHKQLLHTIACTIIISNKNFHGMLKPTQVGMASPNFMEKTIAGGSKTAKFVNASKVFHYTVTAQ